LVGVKNNEKRKNLRADMIFKKKKQFLTKERE